MSESLGKVCIVGGGGFVGCNLAREMIKQHYQVILFDVNFLDWTPHKALQIKGDIRDEDKLEKGFEGCDAVFHLVGYGMSGGAAMNKPMIESINVGGTEKVIRACITAGVPRLLFASSVSVVFGGREIENGKEEDLDYIPLNKQDGHYSRTKTLSEQKILAANGTPLEGGEGGVLRTCALRLSGVYGLGEARHQPRVEAFCAKGWYYCTYGKGNEAMVDFTSGENAAQAFRKAYEGLKPEKGYIASGQAYSINDGVPIDGFQMFKPLSDLFCPFPTIRLPYLIMYTIACIFELIYKFAPDFDKHHVIPGITRLEVNSVGVAHTFSIEKARKELGYQPTNPNDMGPVVEYYKKKLISEGKIPRVTSSKSTDPAIESEKVATENDNAKIGHESAENVRSGWESWKTVSLIALAVSWFLIIVPVLLYSHSVMKSV
jgi:nucleoside-diphosphate-sugar epimerase